MTIRALRPTLLVLLFAGAVALVVVFSNAASSSPPPTQSHRVREFFALLRSPSVNVRNPAARSSLMSAAFAKPRVRFTHAYLAERDGLWVLSSKRWLCIAQAEAVSCAPTTVAIKEGVLLATFRPPTKRFPAPRDFLLQGLVPDDVQQVVVTIGKRRQLILDVKNNVFSVERDQPVHLKRLLRDD
jgi:hypothetical protein